MCCPKETFGVEVVIAAADKCAGNCLEDPATACIRWDEATEPYAQNCSPEA